MLSEELLGSAIVPPAHLSSFHCRSHVWATPPTTAASWHTFIPWPCPAPATLWRNNEILLTLKAKLSRVSLDDHAITQTLTAQSLETLFSWIIAIMLRGSPGCAKTQCVERLVCRLSRAHTLNHHRAGNRQVIVWAETSSHLKNKNEPA